MLGLAALGAVPGCIGLGFDLADLPGEPLVIVYRTREESERRVELMQQSRESALRRERGSTYEASYLKLEAAADALGLGRPAAEKAADLLGRMSFVDARREAVEPLEFAFRGDRPLDWSPDHQRLLFASLRSEAVQVYEWDRGSGEVRPVTMGPAEHPTGSYGPDGRLAVTEQVPSPDGTKRISRILLTAPGGASPQRLTEGPGDSKPEWSPDGRWIVYETRDPAGRPAVASVPADGSAPPRILAPGRDPTFTPDGRFVVQRAHAGGLAAGGCTPTASAAAATGDPRVAPTGAMPCTSTTTRRQQLRVRRSPPEGSAADLNGRHRAGGALGRGRTRRWTQAVERRGRRGTSSPCTAGSRSTSTAPSP
jgi:dipeptidyl aminopeptidase/acylaminoacyl peptidase